MVQFTDKKEMYSPLMYKLTEQYESYSLNDIFSYFQCILFMKKAFLFL